MIRRTPFGVADDGELTTIRAVVCEPPHAVHDHYARAIDDEPEVAMKAG
jgi:hypothetical protein